MSISDKLRQSLSIEVKHYIDCPINKECDRCQLLIKQLKALKVKN